MLSCYLGRRPAKRVDQFKHIFTAGYNFAVVRRSERRIVAGPHIRGLKSAVLLRLFATNLKPLDLEEPLLEPAKSLDKGHVLCGLENHRFK